MKKITMCRTIGVLAGAGLLLSAGTAVAEAPKAQVELAQAQPKVVLAMSGWTGFAPFTLAREKGLHRKHGIDFEIKKMPPQARHAAMAAGEVHAISTTIDTHITYVAANVPVTQVLVIDSSTGGDGVLVKGAIRSFADLKGKSVAVDNPGAVSNFWFNYLLKKNGMSMKDVRASNMGPQPAANAFAAGQFDAAVTYEPYMSGALKSFAEGRVLLSSKDTPGIIIDTLAFQPDYVKANPKAVKAVVDMWFEALALVKSDPDANRVMGADVKQSPEDFARSAALVTWYDKAANRDYFAKTIAPFMQEAADILLETGVIKRMPDLKVMADDSFVK
ncbi:MAG: transporter substrate-binding domain-containing protein [Alphaproteobacteria bacterium]|nr:transporter substrate-binding domain-containing protein [Alphaproteobacteria bacterium]